MIDIKENISLKNFNTFNVGGKAKYFVKVDNHDDLVQALKWAKDKKLPVYIFGGGSNLLISDDGYHGLIIQIASKKIVVNDQEVICDAGALLQDLINTAIDHSLNGICKLSGIPGSVGGAVRGNAGAFGTEIKDVLQETTILNKQTYEIKKLSNDDCNFSYRHSFFKDNPEWVILAATFKLTIGQKHELLKKSQNTLDQRNKKQIQDIKSAGSTFINPTITDQKIIEEFEKESGTKSRGNRVPAGWLLDKVGLRGHKIGGAATSPMHPNYFINTNNATSADIVKLIELSKKKVKEKFNIDLQEELQYLGF